MEPALWIGPAIVAAFISSVVTIGGWWVHSWQERRREETRRAEKIRDFQTALLAEVRSFRRRFAGIDLNAHLDTMTAHILSAAKDAPYTPFVPHEASNPVWNTVVKEIHILPIDVIDAVVVLFGQIETIGYFIEDLRGDAYARLDKERKAQMYADLVKLRQSALLLAEEATARLQAALGLPTVSSPGPAPSGPQLASA